MPPKKKKPALNDEYVQGTMDFVTKRWPEMNITVSMIRNPTREFVLKFYSNYVDELEDIIAEATRSPRVPGPSGLSEEEALFFKLSKIPVLMKTDFKLGDLYQFDPFRINMHFHILIHFLYFTNSIKNQAVNICDRVFDAKQELEDMKESEEKLKELRIQKQIELKNVQDKSKEVQRTAAVLTPAYEKTLDLIEKSEEKCKHKIFEIEKLKEELKIYDEEIQKLEKTEEDLRSQVITESEHKMLKDKLESLKAEESNLEDIDLNNFLFEQNKQIEHLQICVSKLEQLRLSDDVYKLSEFRTQLQNERHNLQHIQHLNNNEKDELSNIQLDLEKENTENEAISKQLKKLQIKVDEANAKVVELTKKKQQLEAENPEVLDRILKLKKIKENQDVLKADFREKYKDMCEMQDKALNKYKNFVNKKAR